MRPGNLTTRIFVDGGNPDETAEAIGILGFVDGQTTNPTLISKNPGVRQRLEKGDRFTRDEIIDYYREVVKKISSMIPKGSVSVEVYADGATKAEAMLEQGREMFGWIPNAHIKFPTSREGLKAAAQAVREGMRVNMTLCFSQSQAAAVFAATRGAMRGNIFVSPFIGRLDDRGENGMDLIANIIRMYARGDGHVEVLTASVRNEDHLLDAIKVASDIVTSPFAILKEWGQKGLSMPGPDFTYRRPNLTPIVYEEIELDKEWQEYDIRHDLTEHGMKRFSDDWNALIR
jgi:transaldolase